MSLILSGTDGLSDVDGTAATPAIRGTDANTGIFFPAADTIAFTEGGAEAMRIDSSGNLGIGTSSPSYKLQVFGASNPEMRLGDATVTYQLYTEGATAAVMGTTTNHALVYRTNATERMRITSGGDVGIGTSSPAYKLEVRSSMAVLDGSANIGFYANGTSYTQVWQTFQSPNDLLIKTTAAKYIAFLPNNTEAMRIDASGNLLFNSGFGSVATAYGCRAWVKFNGTGTVAIGGSGNISSITDNGVGDYTANFTTAMPDTTYSVVGIPQNANQLSVQIASTNNTSAPTTYTASALRFNIAQGGSLFDSATICLSFFR